MKKSITAVIVLGVMMWIATAQVDTEHKDLIDRLMKVMNRAPWDASDREFYEKARAAGISPTFDHVESRAKAALQYAKTNGIPLEVVLEAVKMQIKSFCTLPEPDEPNIPRGEPTKCKWMLAVLVAAEDSSSLPFLEEMSFLSGNEWVRKDSARAYISLASTNSAPFIRKLMTDDWHKNDRLTSPLLDFLQILERAPEVSEESLVFLLGFAEKNDHARNVKDVDKTLCKILPSYSNSVQRLAVARRQLEDDNVQGKGFFAERWTPIRAEIENVPEPQRKDFRAKGELLDPDRKKEP